MLYPALPRDLLIRLAQARLLAVRWTDEILEEMVTAILRNNDHLTKGQLDRTVMLMNEAIPDALLEPPQALPPGIALPDPGDHHVLAAAIATDADIIVTENIRDFPSGILQRLGVTVVTLDDLLSGTWIAAPELFAKALHELVEDLKDPPMSRADVLGSMERSGLSETAARLQGELVP